MKKHPDVIIEKTIKTMSQFSILNNKNSKRREI